MVKLNDDEVHFFCSCCVPPAQLAEIPSTMKVICVGFGIILVMPQGLGTMRDLIRVLEKMVHSEGFFKVLTVLFIVEMVVFLSFSIFLHIRI